MKLKYILIFSIAVTILSGCATVGKYNRNLNALRSEDELKSDVDYLHKNLQKLHPRLYWYTSKNDLDYKFDSLKSSIHSPMTSNEFYFRLCPVLGAVKQGHIRVVPLTRRIKTIEWFDQLVVGTTPLSQYEFEQFDGKLYIVRNISGNKSFKPGTEVVTINNVPPRDLIMKYSNTLFSDGNNQVFTKRRLGLEFPTLFYYQNDVTDSLLCELKYNDTITSIYLKRKELKRTAENAKTAEQRKVEKEKQKKDAWSKDERGYNSLTKTFSKNLTFVEPDSSIAIMKVRDFSGGVYQTFYSKSFKLLDSLKTGTLILDLRDNPGGLASDAKCLFSYLTDTNFVFFDRAEVASRWSITHENVLKGYPQLFKALLAITYPAQLISKGMLYLMIEKGEDNKYYFQLPENNSSAAKKRHFKGKVYVLINGGSFSAACILASNLKGSKRGIFVGEETGGAYNGTVAGRMAAITLPSSRLNIFFGLVVVQPFYKTETEGRGILPDIEIKPTLDDRIKGIDPELQWILEDVKAAGSQQ